MDKLERAAGQRGSSAVSGARTYRGNGPPGSTVTLGAAAAPSKSKMVWSCCLKEAPDAPGCVVDTPTHIGDLATLRRWQQAGGGTTTASLGTAPLPVTAPAGLHRGRRGVPALLNGGSVAFAPRSPRSSIQCAVRHLGASTRRASPRSRRSVARGTPGAEALPRDPLYAGMSGTLEDNSATASATSWQWASSSSSRPQRGGNAKGDLTPRRQRSNNSSHSSPRPASARR